LICVLVHAYMRWIGEERGLTRVVNSSCDSIALTILDDIDWVDG
jgi:hypothetical protein